jgi:hypothetical protein
MVGAGGVGVDGGRDVVRGEVGGPCSLEDGGGGDGDG